MAVVGNTRAQTRVEQVSAQVKKMTLEYAVPMRWKAATTLICL